MIELLRTLDETDEHFWLRCQIAVHDAAITRQSQLEYVSRDLASGRPNLDLVKHRWQLELLRAGLLFELAQLEALE